MKNNCDYFPHYVTMRNHRKVKVLRNKFGAVLGYAYWSMMLEWITELNGNSFKYNDFEVEMFASELGEPKETVKEMIDYSIKIGLLDLNGDTIFSNSLDDFLAPVYNKREKNKEAAKKRRRGKGGLFSSDLVEYADTVPRDLVVSPDFEPQSRVEYSRVENSKEENTGKGKKKFIPPALQEVVEYFKEKGYDEVLARKAHEYYELGGWKDGRGNPVRSWKQKMFVNWFKEEHKIKPKKEDRDDSW